MKNILIILILLVLVCGCASVPTNEEKAKSLIEESLKKTMNDWSSYEFVEINKLDSTFTTFLGSEEGTKLYRLKNNAATKVSTFSIDLEYPDAYTKKEYKVLQDSLTYWQEMKVKYENEYKEAENNFKREFDGYYTTFKCRGNNSVGAKVLNTFVYKFNKDLTAIVYSRNKDE